ncbi:hypothetical protein VPKG_00028 [Vibrio phage pYD21-A]|uniref:hypothetical protein n=1 Tax=Vibrio phage pYD21-A TaxID=754049 RepID=UPI0002C04C34|nr:hypothetical protein VPKG_00028 [Vibrio phage pYD21-A]AGH16065.1 hypothetical protein VPKG_00028 [Vibrio phage pYD21-A]
MATLKEKYEALEKEHAALKESLASQSLDVEVVSESDINRDSLRLAMVNAGMVRKEHARADAQQVDKAIDDILSVWQ